MTYKRWTVIHVDFTTDNFSFAEKFNRLKWNYGSCISDRGYRSIHQ